VDDQENILFHYMDKKGNPFMWNKEKYSLLLILHADLLMDIPCPVSVTSTFMDVSNRNVSEAEHLFVVVVFIFYFYACKLSQTWGRGRIR
jgi:hypothetical protein